MNLKVLLEINGFIMIQRDQTAAPRDFSILLIFDVA
jgi:hypothetical protein